MPYASARRLFKDMQDGHRRCAEVDVRIRQPCEIAIMNLLSGMIKTANKLLPDKREMR